MEQPLSSYTSHQYRHPLTYGTLAAHLTSAWMHSPAQTPLARLSPTSFYVSSHHCSPPARVVLALLLERHLAGHYVRNRRSPAGVSPASGGGHLAAALYFHTRGWLDTPKQHVPRKLQENPASLSVTTSKSYLL
eukprot:scaffold1204_cov407-Prasinococcus_capsulatus_cf.AAC.7